MVMNEIHSHGQSKDLPRSNVRFSVLALLFVNVVINYMDRANISVAATSLGEDLQLTTVQLGFIFSAFGWTYAAFQIPGGLLVDYLGPRLLYALSLVSWSVMTLLQGFVNQFSLLFSLRLGVGMLEAPAYPINNHIVTSWFPHQERAFAIAIYTSGQYVGLALLAPAMMSIQHYMGWRMLFILTGLVGIVWGIFWYVLYRDPEASRRVNRAELDHIEKGGGLIHKPDGTDARKSSTFKWENLKIVFSHRKLWGIYIGQFMLGANMWFFMTWFPTYLVKYRGLGFLQTGYLTSIPFLAAFAGILLSGYLSDRMVRKGFSVGFARKSPIILGFILAVTIVAANYVESPTLIVIIMAIAFFGTGLASITWIFVSLLAPKNLLGLTGGAFNFIGNLSSIVIPIVIGYLVQEGDFAPALIFVSSLGVIGLCSYVFLVGKIERVVT